MNKKARLVINLIVAVLIIILGIFILIRKDLFKEIFMVAIGLVVLVASIRSLITMMKFPLGKMSRNFTLAKGILGLIIAVLAIVMPIATGETVWLILLYSLAIQLLLASIVLIIDSFVLHRVGFPILPLISEALISLAVAIALFVFPKSIADLLVNILGVVVIIVGLATGLFSYLFRKKATVVEVELY